MELFKGMRKCHFELIICLFYLFLDIFKDFLEKTYPKIREMKRGCRKTGDYMPKQKINILINYFKPLL